MKYTEYSHEALCLLLAERDAEMKDLRQIITTYSDQEGENASLREEVERLKQVDCSTCAGREINEVIDDTRKQAAQEIIKFIREECTRQDLSGRGDGAYCVDEQDITEIERRF